MGLRPLKKAVRTSEGGKGAWVTYPEPCARLGWAVAAWRGQTLVGTGLGEASHCCPSEKESQSSCVPPF